MTAQATPLPDAVYSPTESEGLAPPETGTLQEAFANGTYPEWIDGEVTREEVSPHIEDDITTALKAMKSLSPEQRMEDYNWIVRYYSRSNKGFEETSLKLYDHIGCSEDDIRSGTYRSRSVAKSMLARLQDYDATCIVPVVKQVRDDLVKNFAESNVLFLGRDFCSAYLYIIKGLTPGGPLKRENLFLSNISRYVRDVALGGQTTELRLVLERLGLTKKVLLQKGLLVADSCMQGKIPAIIFKSLALHMSEEERYSFLKHCQIRYLKSSRREGLTISEKTMKVGAAAGKLTNEDLDTILAHRIERIEEFDITYPTIVEEYLPRRHKIFEWRPKLSLISMGITVDAQGARLVADEPKTPSEKILSLLGLYGEIQFAKAAIRERAEKLAKEPVVAQSEHGNFNPKKMALEVSLLDSQRPKPVGHHVVSNGKAGVIYTPPAPVKPGWFLKEIDKALKGGIEGLREWQSKVDSNVGSVAVMKTKDLVYLYELVINGKVIYRFRDIVGEGNNVKVYVAENGNIVKVIKDPKHVRKNLMLAWAEPIVRAAGIETAKVLNVSPTGLFLEQEAVPGDSLETLYGDPDQGIKIPKALCDRVIADFRAGKKLVKEKGIWLDLKAANYHLSPDSGAIVNVDYAPRLNPTFYRYFQTDPLEVGSDKRRDLKDEEFLDKFFHHDVRKRKCLPKAPEKCEPKK